MHREDRGRSSKRTDYYDRPDDLEPLSDMDEYQVAEDEPEIVGWNVVDYEGEKLGKVDDLIVDTSTDEAVYAVVSYGRKLGVGGDRTLLPLDAVDFDEDERVVVAQGDADTFADAPEYTKGSHDYSRYNDYWAGAATAGRNSRSQKTYTRRTRGTKAGDVEEARIVGEGRRKYRVYRRDTDEVRLAEEDEQALRKGEPVVIPVTEKKEVVTGEMVIEPEDVEEEEEEHTAHRRRRD